MNWPLLQSLLLMSARMRELAFLLFSALQCVLLQGGGCSGVKTKPCLFSTALHRKVLIGGWRRNLLGIRSVILDCNLVCVHHPTTSFMFMCTTACGNTLVYETGKNWQEFIVKITRSFGVYEQAPILSLKAIALSQRNREGSCFPG